MLLTLNGGRILARGGTAGGEPVAPSGTCRSCAAGHLSDVRLGRIDAMPRPTLFRLLVQERHWDNWAVFCDHFEEAARALAKEARDPRLASVTVARRTFDRWFMRRLVRAPAEGRGAGAGASPGFSPDGVVRAGCLMSSKPERRSTTAAAYGHPSKSASDGPRRGCSCPQQMTSRTLGNWRAARSWTAPPPLSTSFRRNGAMTRSLFILQTLEPLRGSSGRLGVAWSSGWRSKTTTCVST